MNRLLLSFFVIPLFLLLSCNGRQSSGTLLEAIEKSDSCRLDPGNTYELYIPERMSPTGKLPMLIILDAHGRGKFALEKFKPGAEKYPVILVASNTIRNGVANYEGIIQTLIGDVAQKYPAANTVFMTGFSGGARMALGYATNHPLNGLILCGALAKADQINALDSPLLSISGMDDFNFVETAQYLFRDKALPSNLKVEFTSDSHDWPANRMLANALGFIYLSCQDAGISSVKKSELKKYSALQRARIDSLVTKGELIKAAQVARNMSSTAPFSKDDSFKSSFSEIVGSSKYTDQLNHLENLLNIEMKVRQAYLDAMLTKDSLWWKNEIETLQGKIKTAPDVMDRDMFRRIKGFLGIACYSYCKQAVKERNPRSLEKVLAIYRLLEPENPDMYYFSSIPHYWNGDDEAALALLRKALEAGFSDMDELMADFPVNISSQLR